MTQSIDEMIAAYRGFRGKDPHPSDDIKLVRDAFFAGWHAAQASAAQREIKQLKRAAQEAIPEPVWTAEKEALLLRLVEMLLPTIKHHEDFMELGALRRAAFNRGGERG